MRQHISISKSLFELSSDHFPVLFSIGKNIEIRELTMKRDIKNADWKKYQNIINQKVSEITPPETIQDLDTSVEKFQNIIIEAINNCTKSKKIRQEKQEIDQFTLRLIRLRNIRRRQYQRSRLLHLKTIINNLNKTIKNSLNRIHNESFGDKIRNMDPYSKPFWKMAKVLRKKQKIIPPILNDKKYVITPFEKCETISEQFEKAHRLSLNTISSIEQKVEETTNFLNNYQILQVESSFCTKEDVEVHLKTLKNFKATGLDNIFNIYLKKLPIKAIEFLTICFNKCSNLCYFPKVWKTAKVIPILKPKKDPKLASSYRPISLLPCLGKLFEKIIHEKIKEHVTENNIYINKQFGFRNGHSTSHQLLRVSNILKSNKNRKYNSAVALLDIEKAFDSVWHKGLIYKLKQFNFPIVIIKLVQSYLTNRYFKVHMNGTFSSSKPIPAGVPQGSILGPTLYNLFTSDIPKFPPHSDLALFADDTAIICNAKPIKTVIKRLKNCIELYFKYLSKWKITPNKAKTQIICFPHKFSKKNIPVEPLVIDNFDIDLDWVKEIKYLGLIFDQKQNYSKHIKDTINKCNFYRNALYSLICRKSKLNIKNKLAVYKQIIRPVMTYGSPVWSSCANTHKNKLQIFENKTLKMILNLPIRTPSIQVYKEANIVNFKNHIQNLNIRFKDKTMLSEYELINTLYE